MKFVTACLEKKIVARQKQQYCQKINFKTDIAQKPDLIEQNECDIRTQNNKISLIQLRKPDDFLAVTQCNQAPVGTSKNSQNRTKTNGHT